MANLFLKIPARGLAGSLAGKAAKPWQVFPQ